MLILGKRFCMVIVQISKDRPLSVGTVVPRDGLEMADCSVVTLGYTMVIVEVSQDTEFLELVELYPEDGFDIGGCLVVKLGNSPWLLLRSPGRECFLSW